jgi:glucosamine--fructose-6-phosphate aminotransferase (isomerizing)
VTNYAGRPLANLGGTNLVLPAGQEQSVAQTRAFTTLYLATMFLAAVWSGSRSLLDQMGALPAAARRLLSVHADHARQLASDDSLDRFYFLGSGPCYGLACELSLKMKEMSLSHSEPFHFLEFRHGPQSMVTAGTLVVGLLSEGTRFHEEAVLGEMRARGARVLTMAEQEADVAFGSGVVESLQSILHLPVGQLLGFERAMFRGLDPDRPLNLSAVVTLDPL